MFVSISMSTSSWLPSYLLPTLGPDNQTARINATKFGEVGIICKKKNSVGDIIDWNLFIPLNPVNYNDKMFISSVRAELFGHIVDTYNQCSAE